MRLLCFLLATLSLAPVASAQPDAPYRLFTDAGEPASVNDLVQAMAASDVVFLGEMHDDDTAHALQALLLAAALRYAPDRPLVLSLEMFERDVQGVLDEYLAGLVREQDLLDAARPWPNYATDYRPLVELAVAHGVPVVAANAPQRYVSRTSRLGPASLDSLSAEAKATLPPLPVAEPSAALAAAFAEVMGPMVSHSAAADTSAADTSAADTSGVPESAASVHGSAPSMANLLAAQNLRDAAMADAVANALAAYPGALVLHVNGTFHSEGGLGAPEHLARLRPGARALVVTMRPDAAFPAFDPAAFRTNGTGFVVVTDPAAR